MSIHDCNGYLAADQNVHLDPYVASTCYFGVFAIDRLRSTAALLSLLRNRGVRNIINFPSISFFDGTMAQTLGTLGYSAAAEKRFLIKARQAGFGIGLCSNKEPTGDDMELLWPESG